MNINRHNYENYFLLYADRELCASDCTLVEAFVTANPDLKKELDTLIKLTLPKEELIFADKQLLYKKNYTLTEVVQNELLLKIDNELEPTALATLNTLIETNNEVNVAYQKLHPAKHK